jgi:hypothetical protein
MPWWRGLVVSSPPAAEEISYGSWDGIPPGYRVADKENLSTILLLEIWKLYVIKTVSLSVLFLLGT